MHAPASRVEKRENVGSALDNVAYGQKPNPVEMHVPNYDGKS
jgi:hypothetical protein